MISESVEPRAAQIGVDGIRVHESRVAQVGAAQVGLGKIGGCEHRARLTDNWLELTVALHRPYARDPRLKDAMSREIFAPIRRGGSARRFGHARDPADALTSLEKSLAASHEDGERALRPVP